MNLPELSLYCLNNFKSSICTSFFGILYNEGVRGEWKIVGQASKNEGRI
jgi:hypothetical protein